MNTELFERAAGAGAQLLRVEKRVHAGDADGRALALRFTFDVGRILLGTDPARGGWVATHVESTEATSPAWVDASEDEPWWRLLGAPLSAVRGSPDGALLELRFRIGEGRWRAAVLRLEAARIHASLRDAA